MSEQERNMDEFDNKQQATGPESLEAENQERPQPYEPEPVPDDAPVKAEALEQDEVVGPPPTPPGRKPDEPGIDELGARDESRFSQMARTSLRWVLGFFIVFGIGFLVALFTLYQPAVDNANAYQDELAAADEQIASLQSQIDDLEGEISDYQGIEGQIDELQSQLGQEELQMRILRARLAVSEASLALYAEEPSQVSLYLDTASESLARIKEELDADQQDVIDMMEQRMLLVLDEYQESPEAAQADLEIIGNRLLELQDTLFGGP